MTLAQRTHLTSSKKLLTVAALALAAFACSPPPDEGDATSAQRYQSRSGFLLFGGTANLCLSVTQPVQAGSRLISETCNASSFGQGWTMATGGTGRQIMPQVNRGLCIDVSSGSPTLQRCLPSTSWYSVYQYFVPGENAPHLRHADRRSVPRRSHVRPARHDAGGLLARERAHHDHDPGVDARADHPDESQRRVADGNRVLAAGRRVFSQCLQNNGTLEPCNGQEDQSWARW